MSGPPGVDVSGEQLPRVALRVLCERYVLEDVAAVLGEWLTRRQSFGGF